MQGRLALALAAAIVMSGCPFGQPSLGPVGNRITSLSKAPADVGTIRGFVRQDAGAPVPGVQVQAGRLTTTTGNPIESELVDEELDDGRTITVMHTFYPQEDPQLAERRPRKYVAPDCKVDDLRYMTDAERWACAYVYLRPGEYFIEGVPAGPNGVKPLVCDLKTPESSVQVLAGTELDHVDLKVDLPVLIALESHGDVMVVEWKGLAPTDPVRVKGTPGGGYQLDPGEVTVTLRSPPGSGGTTVVATDIEYKWTVEQGSKVIRRSSGRREIPHTTIGPAAGFCWGPPTDIKVQLGSAALDGAFGATDSPSHVEASIAFIDRMGYPVQTSSLENLRVPVTLSR